jgi:hypothetical protein
MSVPAAAQPALRDASHVVVGRLCAWWRRAPSPRFRAILFALATLLLITGLRRHAMWLDEVQAWLIVRDSHGLADLLRNLRYEGHPGLWYLLLYPLSALGRQPQWMQCAQALCAIGSVALITWRGPFSRLELALLPLSYGLLFEYGVKSRSYALGNLLLLAFCALWPRRRERPVLLALVLAAMANVHALFAIVACVAWGAMLIDQATRTSIAALATRTNALCGAILLAGVVAAAATAWPAPDSGFFVGWQTDVSPRHVAHTFKALSGFTVELTANRADYLAAAFGIVLVGAGASRLRTHPAAAFLLVAGTLGMEALVHLKDLQHPWHHGLFFSVLVAAVWIGRAAEPTPSPRTTHGILPRLLFAAALGLQALHGVASYARDAVQEYSSGREVAAFITRNGWADAPILALEDFSATSVFGDLDIDRIYYAQGARWGSFILFDDRRIQPIDETAFYALAQRIRPSPTILDCSVERAQERPTAHGFVPVLTTKEATNHERCTIYRKAE